MIEYDNTNPAPIVYGVAARPFPGQTELGDAYLVQSFTGGTLVAVIDGLGHGPKAAYASRTAVSVMEPYAADPVTRLFERCHKELVKTRGAAISLASFSTHDGTMTWVGVGNVVGLLLHADTTDNSPPRERLLLRGGVVGFRVPTLRPVTVQVAPGDTLILVTDGVRSSFSEDLHVNGSPQVTANHILEHHSRGTDDALVLVARYKGP